MLTYADVCGIHMRHVRLTKAQLRRYESHEGPLVRLKDLPAAKLNGAFLKGMLTYASVC
jgi:hypothetical protein